jgi:hypothetical protein
MDVLDPPRPTFRKMDVPTLVLTTYDEASP